MYCEKLKLTPGNFAARSLARAVRSHSQPIPVDFCRPFKSVLPWSASYPAPFPEPRSGCAWPNGSSTAVITYFSLVIGELVPKQIALRDPEKIAVRVAPVMTAMATIASPIVSFLDFSGRAVLSALGYQDRPVHRVTDEEIRSLMAEAETAGVLEPGERAMIAGVMRLGDRPVRAIMTPRREVDMVDLTADPDDIRRTIVESAHSRLPVHAGTPEEMLGIVQSKDLLNAYLRGERRDIRAQVRPASNVPDTADALDVLDAIKGSPVHMALVHDEYGQFEGIVTNADILEARRF